MPDESNGQCIAIYVRRADKGSEMRLVSFAEYAAAAELLWEGGYMNNSMRNNDIGSINSSSSNTSSRPLIFIGTEDTAVLEEAEEWGKRKGYQVINNDYYYYYCFPLCCISLRIYLFSIDLHRSCSWCTFDFVIFSFIFILSIAVGFISLPFVESIFSVF